MSKELSPKNTIHLEWSELSYSKNNTKGQANIQNKIYAFLIKDKLVLEENVGIVPFVTTTLKGRFVVFSQWFLIGNFRLG